MIRKFTVRVVVALLSLVFVGSCRQADVLQRVAQALSADRVKTLEFKASGVNYTVGQNFTTKDPWPPVTWPALVKRMASDFAK